MDKEQLGQLDSRLGCLSSWLLVVCAVGGDKDAPQRLLRTNNKRRGRVDAVSDSSANSFGESNLESVGKGKYVVLFEKVDDTVVRKVFGDLALLLERFRKPSRTGLPLCTWVALIWQCGSEITAETPPYAWGWRGLEGKRPEVIGNISSLNGF